MAVNFVEFAPNPRYTHDCDQCKPLGQWAEYDLYFCERGDIQTVIARFGSEGSQYNSGIGMMSTPLVIAEALAYREGFFKTAVVEGEKGKLKLDIPFRWLSAQPP